MHPFSQIFRLKSVKELHSVHILKGEYTIQYQINVPVHFKNNSWVLQQVQGGMLKNSEKSLGIHLFQGVHLKVGILRKLICLAMQTFCSNAFALVKYNLQLDTNICSRCAVIIDFSSLLYIFLYYLKKFRGGIRGTLI